VSGAQPVATGALTPPDGIVHQGVTREQVDALAIGLQEALGAQYHVEKPLGAGGFAVVYLVRDLNLKRKLAVKVLSPDVIASRTALERFRREAETVAQLSHPNIVPLHFVGQKDDLVYLVMECVEGGSLADRVEKEGRLPPEDVAQIIREVASALAYAHKRGVIHRDIKPHNVLIEAETGRCLVTDFGIARTAEGSSLTASGMMVGTPAYLSPEQVTGQPTDHRADIYALGVMGYEMLTGQPPFTGPTPTAVLMKRLAGAPTPIQKLRPDVPALLRDAVEGCMAQDPGERFQNAADIVRALGGQTPVSAGHSTAEYVLKTRRERRRRGAFLAAGAFVVVAGALAGVHFLKPSPPPAPPRLDAGMLIVPGGLFTIGRDDGPAIARPAHQVRVDSFALDVREVTAGEYAAYASAHRAPLPWGQGAPDSSLPVTSVSWSEATNYCVSAHADGGRLPTEEEWEAAARGSEARRYPWGNDWDPAAANTEGSHRAGPAPGGSFPLGATPRGFVDLIGNVWEWTSSRLVAYPGGSIPAGYPQGAYVIRGGAYNTPDALATATLRGGVLPTVSDRAGLAQTGFRCAMPLRPAQGR
jgi:formylglycine-generating enzyme required for sulfatase activity/tRNA A-37 threonylcarbamoyl transferase component Bud32